VVTVVLPEQRRDTQLLLRKAGITAQPQQVAADSAQVRGLIGEVAPYRAPAPTAAPPARPANSRQRRHVGAGQAQSHQPARGQANSHGGDPRRRSRRPRQTSR
jgi:hypothetical protein